MFASLRMRLALELVTQWLLLEVRICCKSLISEKSVESRFFGQGENKRLLCDGFVIPENRSIRSLKAKTFSYF